MAYPSLNTASASNHTSEVRRCSIWRALEVVGDVPTMLILQACWLGERRFAGLAQRTGLLRALLSQRLKQMQSAQLLETRQYQQRPPRREYLLSARALDLYPAALAMLRWEKRWGDPLGPVRIQLDHRDCGHSDVEPVPHSRGANCAYTARDVRWEIGPGAGVEPAQPARRRQPRSASLRTEGQLLDTVIQVLGDRWASLILRAIFTGVRRYDAIQQDVGAATNILAHRLQWLLQLGLLCQREYQRAPSRYEYRLTAAGMDYYPVLVSLLVWGDRWYPQPKGPPLRLFHRDSAQPLDPVMVCSHCQQPLLPERVRYRVMPC